MYQGRHGSSPLPLTDNLGHSPSDSIDLSPIEMSRPIDMVQLTGQQLPFEPMTGVEGARRLNNPAPWGLISFYACEDEPWNVFTQSASATHPRNGVKTVDVRRNASAFASWRSTGATSDGGTVPKYIPSDSGYESRAKHSIDDGSVYEENQDTQSLSGHMIDFHPFRLNTPGFARDIPAHPWYPAPTPLPVQNRNSEKQLVCPDCHAPCKTKSELNKHNQRHLKAHKCDFPGCTRKDGFGTLNDLERHRNSVHPELPTSGPRYRCHIGPCQNKEKIWPRADNFRQHLKRVHHKNVQPDDDLGDFVYQHQKPATEVLRTVQEDDLEGVGSELCKLTADPQAEELTSPEQPTDLVDLALDPNLTNAEGAQNIRLFQTEYIHPNEISRQASVAETTTTAYTELGGLRTVQPQITVDLTETLETPTSPQKSCKRSVTDGTDSYFPFASPSNNSSSGLTGQEEAPSQGSFISIDSLNEQDALKLLEKFPTIVEKLIKTRSETTASTTLMALPRQSRITDTRHRCSHQGCAKSFARRCELRKHMKRHDKPYGCTFRGCEKKFGSKNDWIRHENSVHYQLEVWKCDGRRTPSAAPIAAAAADDDEVSTTSSSSAPCGKICHRRETFRYHLQKAHKAEDRQKIDKALEECRVGRDQPSLFWCGLCVSVIDVTDDQANWFTERFNHIDNHITGRDNVPKKDISEWKNADPRLVGMDIMGANELAVPRRSGASRKRGAEDTGDVERGHKHPKTGTRVTLMWHCCECQTYADAKIHDGCVQCDHKRCGNCGVQEVTVR